MTVHCADIRKGLSFGQNRPSSDASRAVEEHLATCAECRGFLSAERALDDALTRLPRYQAPTALRSKLFPGAKAPALGRRPFRAAWFGASWAAIGAAAAVAILTMRPVRTPQATGQGDPLSLEATNDHLRLLFAQHPLDIESGGIHQVKPWFAGKLDFAAVVAFEGDEEFPLQGGAVAYLLDRKAAALVYKRRLHPISLFVVRAEGLPWPTSGLSPMGRVEARLSTVRGFNVALWRDGELGYALVSDVSLPELTLLGARIAGPR
jgi:anti-sigma factor RsiW